MDCPALEFFTEDRLEIVRQAFQGTPSCVLRQAWRKSPEAGFAPATVQVGWRDESLLVLAELKDEDIFTKARDFVKAGDPFERFWELGDVFEMFLRPVNQHSYWEFHVTPNNRRAQLRFASGEALRQLQKSGEFEKAVVGGKAFRSSVWLRPEEGRWIVFAEISATAVFEQSRPLGGSEWAFSFSRYDYTRGHAEPVVSSTSAHEAADFHVQAGWGRLRFLPKTAAAQKTFNFHEHKKQT